ncbi:MAG TPA: low-complexity protein [Woeseiaceae bacterium]|nr:low-complexity protein [Woeseiaceae bacterium]
MNDKHMKKPIAIAVGAALAATFGAVGVAQAQSDQGAGSPFQMTSLSSGYEATGGHGEGSCGEGKCGGDKEDKGGEGACGEGKCGGSV